MDKSVENFAAQLGLPIDTLIQELNNSGVTVKSNDKLTDEHKILFLEYLRKQYGANSLQVVSKTVKPTVKMLIPKTDTDSSLKNISTSNNLNELNLFLTQAMANRTIQSVIKDDNLDMVIDSVFKLTKTEGEQLLSAAILGRLAAVARGREEKVLSRVNLLFSKKPESVETLNDGESKQYAAQVISNVSGNWVKEYSYSESILIDTADYARREFLIANLSREENIAVWISAISSHSKLLMEISNIDSRVKRIRRIFGAMNESLVQWRGEVGENIGLNLAECLKSFVKKDVFEADQTVLFEALDYLLSILIRIIELRFSKALYASTYELLEQGKSSLGNILWKNFLNNSAVISQIRVALLEAALVLARQNRSDKQIMEKIVAAYSSKAQAAIAIERHFKNASDLDPEIAEWWKNAGNDSDNQKNVEHKVGNTEDSQIGALLIEVESNKESMEKVGRAGVDFLSITDPVLASTLKKAVDGYQEIAQIARRLARMRKLTKTDLKGERLEYNSLEHEMLGGHKAGVRRVKIVRDGIKKDFAGKIKTLVKPWVEPEE